MQQFTQRQITVIAGGILIFVVLVVLLFRFGVMGDDESRTDTGNGKQQLPTEDPVDVMTDFYSAWLSAVTSTSTDPYRSGLATAPVLGEEVSARLVSSEGKDDAGVDPVLCQTSAPAGIRTRTIFALEDSAQILYVPRGAIQQALVTLTALDGEWRITGIECTHGESGPEREFSFVREGNLLKSVPPPLDPQYWHLVFEENNVMGHTAPLFFDSESTCITTDGSGSVCNPDEFTETVRVRIEGQLGETGVTVKRLEFLE